MLNRIYRRPRLGLALSGGGARGIAHIGVLRVLQQAGVPVHCVAGTSAGGVIGAGFCAGMSPDALAQEALYLSNVRHLVRLMDHVPSRLGLLAGERIAAYIISKIGRCDFRDLQIPLALITVDLESGDEVILDRGSVVDAVRATMAYPAVFEPREMDGRLLVDGGLLNNLPVDVPRRMGADAVIAVDVSAPQEYLGDLSEMAGRNHLLPQVRLTMAMVARCIDIMMHRIRAQKLAQYPPDVLICPAIPADVGIFSGFSRAAECIAAGEEAARDALPAIERAMKRRIWWPRAARGG